MSDQSKRIAVQDTPTPTHRQLCESQSLSQSQLSSIVSLSLISYFICSKASNQSDLMQHNVPAAIFHLAQYSVCSSRQRCRRAFGVGRVFLRVRVVAKHNNMHFARQHRVRSERLPHFGEMFQWRKSSVCCFGALICICGARRRQF